MLDSVKQVVTDYLNASSIHGMQYLNQGWNLVEKAIWLVVMITSLTCAGVLIQQGLQEAEEEPMLVTTKNVPVNEVPLPAITISPETNGIYPFGFQQRMLDLFAFYDPWDSKVYQDSKELKKYFRPILDSRLKRLEDLMKKEPNQIFDQVGPHWADELSRMAKKLFLIAETNSTNESFLNISLQLKALENDVVLKHKPGVLVSVVHKISGILDQYDLPDGYDGKPLNCSSYSPDVVELCLSAYDLVTMPFQLLPEEENYEHFGIELGLLNSSMGLGSLIYRDEPFGFDQLFENYDLSVDEIFLKEYWKSAIERLAKESGEHTLDSASVFDLVTALDRRPAFDYYGNIWNFGLFSKAYQMERKCKDIHLEKVLDYQCHGKYQLNLQCQKKRKATDMCSGNATETAERCCQMLSVFEKSLSTVLKVFRYVMPTPGAIEDLDEIMEIYNNLNFLGNFTLWQNETKAHWLSLIVACRNGDTFNDFFLLTQKDSGMCDKTMFSRSITNNGFGYSHNVGNFWDLFKNTSYTRTFAHIMRPKGHDQLSDETCWRNDDCKYPQGTVKFPQSGPLAFANSDGGSPDQLHLLLQMPRKIGEDADKQYSFKLAIHDPMTLPDLRSLASVTEIKPGYVTTFRITPSQEVTAGAARALTDKERNCRFKSQSSDSTLFKSYSRAGCLLECQMKKAFETCQCIPWNYPHFKDNQTICHRYTQECFETELNKNSDLDDCNCPYDCSLTTYSFSVTQKPISSNLCSPYFLQPLTYAFTAYPRFVKKPSLEGFLLNDTCRDYVNKHLAIASFHLTQSKINQMNRTPRVTFSSQLANIGGTLGLFSGISILSLFEIIFWLVRCANSTNCANSANSPNSASSHPKTEVKQR